MDIGLKAKINEFVEKFDINKTTIKEADIFEDFSNYLVVSTILQDEIDEINKISTNKAQGIDGIGIFVNNKLISEESDLDKIGENEKIKLKITFIQSTIKNSFSEQKFQAFIDEIIKFLSNDITVEPFSQIVNKLLDEEGEYIDNLIETPFIYICFLSKNTNHTIEDETLEIEKNKFSKREDVRNKFLLKEINFWQKEEIKSNYDRIKKYHTISLKFHKSIQLETRKDVKISILSALKFSELQKMILTNDGNIKEKLFIENPRSHLGATNVNMDIRNTILNEEYKPYFLYLNNGITILCDKIERHPAKDDEFVLTFPRIINGCQTTHMLYEQYKENPEKVENIEIIAKVIATENPDLKKQIIFAANNQNSIGKDLQSLNKYHEKIEEYYKGNDDKLFYERLRGQYSNIIKPYKKINIENLAKVYISVFLQEPHKMKSNAIKKIEKYQNEKKIFYDENDYCGILYYYLNKFLLNKQIVLKSKTMDMHLLLGVNLFLDKKYSKLEKKIDSLKSENDVFTIFKNTNVFLTEQKYLFEKRGFYSSPKTKKLVNSIKER